MFALPKVTLGSVMPFFLVNASKSLDQSAQPVAPCHEYGGISSMMKDWAEQVASAVFASPLLKASTNSFTFLITSTSSDADAEPVISVAANSAAIIVRMALPP
jgi:hypothetical protein